MSSHTPSITHYFNIGSYTHTDGNEYYGVALSGYVDVEIKGNGTHSDYFVFNPGISLDTGAAATLSISGAALNNSGEFKYKFTKVEAITLVDQPYHEVRVDYDIEIESDDLGQHGSITQIAYTVFVRQKP